MRAAFDVTPLVDVVLLLLIFFMLTSSFIFQPGIKVDPPRAPIAGGVNTRHIISLFPGEPPLIFFNDQLTSYETLKEKLNVIAQKEPQTVIAIKADKNISHGLFVRVMGLAIRAGLPAVIATQPEEDKKTQP